MGALAVLVLVAASVAVDTIHLRGGEAGVLGEIKTIDGSGIRIQSPDGMTQMIPWDRIKEIDAPDHEALAATYAVRAMKLFRARSRVDRGDFAMAEPIFAELFRPEATAATETNLVIAQGLLRCRLARGANAQAVVPLLQTMQWRRAGVTTVGDETAAAVIDPETVASPFVPPVFISGPATQVLQQALNDLNAGSELAVARWRDLYQYALSPHGGPLVPPKDADPIAWDMVASIDADPGVRSAARARLEAALKRDDLPPWQTTWAEFAMGRSLLHEPSQRQRQRGMLHAATVVATATGTQPFLAGLALDMMAEYEAAQGRQETAAWLERELRRTMPGHPLLDQKLQR
jgi:hypothetical protein